MDDRLIADEFFRGSYTTGFWVKGEFATKFKYMAMIANNLSTLGVSASQLDNTLDTTSVMLQWLPTTGENGLYGTFGDFDNHQKVATRFGVHYTQQHRGQAEPARNRRDREHARSGSTDGSSIFTPDLFGPGITVDKVRYQMASVDGGVKYKGFSLEAEFFWRWLSDFRGTNTAGIADIDDHGYQVQASAMAIQETLQFYAGASGIYGDYGDASEVRAGAQLVLRQAARAQEFTANGFICGSAPSATPRFRIPSEATETSSTSTSK